MLLSPYLKSILISFIGTGIGWGLTYIGAFGEFGEFGLFGGPMIGLIISWKYTSTCVDSKQDRLLLLFLNPILYLLVFFTVFLICLRIDIARNGFHPWNY